jgi:hypothetical protein
LNLISIHILLGLLAVAALWVIGIGQALAKAGSRIITAAALIVGAAMVVVGMIQSSVMAGEFHWVIRAIHLMLGLLTIGTGHMAAARFRKGSAG